MTDDLESRVRRLEDRAAIGETVTKYAVAVDQRDWTMFADCFTDPVHADYSENGLPRRTSLALTLSPSSATPFVVTRRPST